ncbi:MAG: MBL fold metallo-hydrolase [Caldilineaceae bacterium]|nr:MBL fold metallo-hydrolase [Caldilineaceae bacterium]
MQPIAENIYQIRLPLPFALNHVNCYLLRDDAGWTMLDTGLHWSAGQQAWHAALAELQLDLSQVQQIVLTHMHPDHFGMAGYFQALTQAPVYLAPREAALAQTVWVEDGWRPALTHHFWQQAGLPDALLTTIAQQTDRLRQMTMPHPVQVVSIEPGRTIAMGGRLWQAIHAPGHADGQLIFYQPEERLLLCGDQVLMKITPNIGLWPTTQPDPLGRYLRSLHSLAVLPVQRAWPGHGRPVEDWQGRLAELQAHHARRLAQMAETAGTGASALTIAQRVFNFAAFSEHEVRFAIAETLAHLVYLVQQGELHAVEQGGVTFYQR